MEQDIDEMLRPNIRAEHARIEHVRKPGQRMPVAPVPGGEGPFDSAPRQTRFNVAVLDINRVVENHQCRVPHRQICQHGNQRKQQANRSRTSHRPLCDSFPRRQQARFHASRPGSAGVSPALRSKISDHETFSSISNKKTGQAS